MAYENLCMYCFEDMGGESICPHCGRDSRAAVPQIQMLPGSLVYHDRFLIGRALGQDATGIVYSAFDTKRESKLRLREYLPRDCAERLNDGSIVPMAGMEDQFEAGLKKLRASVEGVEDPRKRHFFFEENGTAYIAQRKNAAGAAMHDEDDMDEGADNSKRRIAIIAGIAAVVVLVAAIIIITLVNGALKSPPDITQSSTLNPDQVWVPAETPTPTPYASPTFSALVDPDLSWMDYTYDGNVENDYNNQQQNASTATPKPTLSGSSSGYTTVNSKSSASDISALQQKLVTLGWLSYTKINGSYDSATRQAVKDYQSYVNEKYSPNQKLDVDGIAGPKTLQWLNETQINRPTASPTPLVTPDPAEKLTVDQNSPTSDVRPVQRKLIVLGLLPAGSDDGKYGATTATAVKRFQTRVNQISGYEVLELTGKVDPLTMAFLNYYVEWWENQQQATATPKPTGVPTATPSPTPSSTPTNEPSENDDTINSGSAKESINRVQQMLIAIGMLPEGSNDGKYGSATISAVADFQEWVNDQRGKHTLDVTGECDPLTVQYLEYCEGNDMRPNGTQAPTDAPTQAPTDAPTQAPTDEPTQAPTDDPGESDGNYVDESSDEESIRFVQQMLSQIGLMNESGADGVYGQGTKNAVSSFQEWVNEQRGENALKVTGKCDDTTLKYLEYCVDHEIAVKAPVDEPTDAPTDAPTDKPTEAPTDEPSAGKVESLELSIGDTAAGNDVIQVPEGPFQISWKANGDVESYYVYVADSEGNSLVATEAFDGTSFNVNVSQLQRGETYTITLGALPTNGTEDDILWKKAQFMLPIQVTNEPEPTMGTVSNLGISIGGVSSGSSTIVVEEDNFQISWSVSGDVECYGYQIKDADGKVLIEQAETEQTAISVRASAMTPGMVYTVLVGARPVNGSNSDALWSSAKFMMPTKATEVPTSEPTAEPTCEPASVGKPSITVGGTAYQEDGISYITDDSIIVSWSASGDVEDYTIIVETESGERQNLGATTNTSRTFSTSSLPSGIYVVYVGAKPEGGSDEDIVWNGYKFGIPAPTQAPTDAPTPEPEVPTPDPTQAPEEFNEPIDGSADADTIQQLQMRLYSLGILSTDGLEAGVLDQKTLQAIAEFQTRVNDNYGGELTVIDPTDMNSIVDVATLDWLFNAEF